MIYLNNEPLHYWYDATVKNTSVSFVRTKWHRPFLGIVVDHRSFLKTKRYADAVSICTIPNREQRRSVKESTGA